MATLNVFTFKTFKLAQSTSDTKWSRIWSLVIPFLSVPFVIASWRKTSITSFSLIHLNSRFGGPSFKLVSLRFLSLTMILSISSSPSWHPPILLSCVWPNALCLTFDRSKLYMHVTDSLTGLLAHDFRWHPVSPSLSHKAHCPFLLPSGR
ncbi:hypothetical protein BD408DRAFT_413505 [Parasitella parasitica]|nr:hypothetical protein BD408DRAFT_413505 [Parasitella parasitica]